MAIIETVKKINKPQVPVDYTLEIENSATVVIIVEL